jgi:cytochrome P450
MVREGTKLIYGDNLLSAHDQRHKKQRKILNPVFSITHLRSLVPIFYGITHQVRGVLCKIVSDGPQEINMLHWFSRTALESIGQAGLGYSFENFESETATSAYARAINDLFPTIFKITIVRQYLPFLVRLGPAWFREFCIQFIPSSNLRKVKRIVDIMHNTTVEILAAKKKALMEGDEATIKQIGEGKDILSTLLRANAAANEADRLPESDVLAQLNLFVVGAHDTTANTLARILHLLTLNPDVQTRLRQEVTEAQAKGDLTYEELMALPYLDAVMRESIRLSVIFLLACLAARSFTILDRYPAGILSLRTFVNFCFSHHYILNIRTQHEKRYNSSFGPSRQVS